VLASKLSKLCSLLCDGVTWRVERVGPSRTAAANRLREALQDRGRAALDGEITPDTTAAMVAAWWLRDRT
jgi:hypothetical protein